MKHYDLAALEYEVLAQLPGAGDGLYGLQVRAVLEQMGRLVTIGSTYKALARLERRGLARSEWGEPTGKPGGRRRRTYQITNHGQVALASAKPDREALLWRFEVD